MRTKLCVCGFCLMCGSRRVGDFSERPEFGLVDVLSQRGASGNNTGSALGGGKGDQRAGKIRTAKACARAVGGHPDTSLTPTTRPPCVRPRAGWASRPLLQRRFPEGGPAPTARDGRKK